jgi:hypothetical protein
MNNANRSHLFSNGKCNKQQRDELTTTRLNFYSKCRRVKKRHKQHLSSSLSNNEDSINIDLSQQLSLPILIASVKDVIQESNSNELRKVVRSILPYIVELCTSRHCCSCVVADLLERCIETDCIDFPLLLKAFHDHVVTLVHSEHGCLVLRKIIDLLSSSESRFIIEELSSHIHEILSIPSGVILIEHILQQNDSNSDLMNSMMMWSSNKSRKRKACDTNDVDYYEPVTKKRIVIK